MSLFLLKRGMIRLWEDSLVDLTLDSPVARGNLGSVAPWKHATYAKFPQNWHSMKEIEACCQDLHLVATLSGRVHHKKEGQHCFRHHHELDEDRPEPKLLATHGQDSCFVCLSHMKP